MTTELGRYVEQLIRIYTVTVAQEKEYRELKVFQKSHKIMILIIGNCLIAHPYFCDFLVVSVLPLCHHFMLYSL